MQDLRLSMYEIPSSRSRLLGKLSLQQFMDGSFTQGTCPGPPLGPRAFEVQTNPSTGLAADIAEACISAFNVSKEGHWGPFVKDSSEQVLERHRQYSTEHAFDGTDDCDPASSSGCHPARQPGGGSGSAHPGTTGKLWQLVLRY